MNGNNTIDVSEMNETVFIASGWYLVTIGVMGAIFNIKALITAIQVQNF